jgi:hypothetical protein
LTDFLVRLVELSDLFLPELFSVKEYLYWHSAATHFTLMHPFGVVVLQPSVQVGLQLFKRMIQFIPECNLVKLMQDSFVEKLTDAVDLRMPRFGSGT